MSDDDLEVRHSERGTEFEYVSVRVGGHTILVREDDGDPHLYLCDHATMRVEGDRKDDVSVVVGTDEFPTEIEALTEREFHERYHD